MEIDHQISYSIARAKKSCMIETDERIKNELQVVSFIVESNKTAMSYSHKREGEW